MLKRKSGKVVEIIGIRGNCIELNVDIKGSIEKAVCYIDLIGDVSVDDELILNTTAVEKSLGTGGYHFVIANISKIDEGDLDTGHIVKLRYTPHQHCVLSVEEEDSPDSYIFEEFESLNGLPVIVGQLHSQLAPAAAGVKTASKSNAKVCYIMTDSACLPLHFSKQVFKLKEEGFIDSTITIGQAFGGDYEAVNIYTALITACDVVQADVVIICPGPGNVGTGTKYGFSSIEQGEIINSINIMNGKAIAIPRISFADPRKRHYGISHHTITSLGKIALTKCIVALPMIDQMKLILLEEQINHSAICYKHTTKIADGKYAILELQKKSINLNTMGRNYEQDSEFFLAGAAAGVIAANFIR
ncbi:MAG: DUF3866 family protein [Armatimonadota bacterium]